MNNIENNAAGLPVENTPTQTLFRFVSLRSPQLSDENDQDKRFVLAPEELKNSHFYKHILDHPGQSKQRLLREYAGIFQQSPDYVSDKTFLKKIIPIFMIWPYGSQKIKVHVQMMSY